MTTITNAQIVEKIFAFSRFMKDQMYFDSELMRLSMLQLQVLVFLKRQEKAQMTQLATYFKIELPSATSLINTLAKQGLVERQPDIHDRRFVRIILTKQGKALLDQALQERSKKMSVVLSHLSEEDKHRLFDIMTKLTDTMEKMYEKK